MNSNSQTIVEKVALNSFKEMVPSLLLNFSIHPEALLTSIVHMGVELTISNEIYDDGVKASAATCVPH